MIPSLRRAVAATALVACTLAAPAAFAYSRFCAAEDSLRFGNRELGSSTMRHRYVVDPRVIPAMANAGWIVEGPVFCSPR